MGKKYLLLLFVAVALSACNKEPYSTERELVPESFSGVIETGPDVDLGLKARWSGYNVGASSPEQFGGYYAWGETATKEEYLESTYSYFVPGTILSGDIDVASKVMGYGYQMPGEEDVQELIDSCTFKFCSYNGVNGWVATSRVKGYEGKSIFFPAAGYSAGKNINYQGSYAVFWLNEQVSSTNERAKNAFFKDSSLCLNIPPKGVGGLAWCGYTIRAVRKFALQIDANDVKVHEDTTRYVAHVTGNAAWTASITGEGASVQPSSGCGDSDIVVTFPKNTTDDSRTYILTVSSVDILQPLTCKIVQFGLTPDFAIDGALYEKIAWNDTTAACALKASSSVSWTASVTCDGVPVSGAKVTPSAGSGSASVDVIIPSSSNMRDTTVYSVDFITSDPRIPAALAKVSYRILQAPTVYVPFSDTELLMGNTFYDKLIQSCSGTASPYILSSTVEVENITVRPNSGSPKTCSIYITTNSYITKKSKISFCSASKGDAILVLYCALAKKSGASDKFITLTWSDKDGATKTVPPEVTAALTNTTTSTKYFDKDSNALQLSLPGVGIGDKITLEMNDSDSHRIYKFYWKKDNSQSGFGDPGQPGVDGSNDTYPGVL